MAKIITIYYSVNSCCTKTIKVPDDFQIKSRNAKNVYEELCKKLPEESLDSIEEDEREHEIEINQFNKIDGVEVFDDKKGIEEKYTNKKVIFKFR